MRARLLFLPLILLLAACQTARVEHDYDTNRDFAAYRSWSWQEPALRYQPEDPRLQSDLTEQRVREAIAEQLDQRGLRPAAQGAESDVKVQAWLIVDERQDQVTINHGGMWGGPWGGYWWGGPSYVETRTLDYQVGTLQIDLYDAKDGKLVWRGSTERILRDSASSPGERANAIREMVAKVLSHYPPL